jgi:hypothetical protein
VKAIGFFFAIFLSMLAVFLLATGEVNRWFSGPTRSPIELADIAGAEERPADGQNLLEFDFYDVEEGRRSFSIRAYLSQGDFHVESKIDQIRELTLRDGTLEVPLAEDVAHTAARDAGTAAGGAPKDLARNVVLQFKSALYTRGDPVDGKRDFVVLLREGKGVLDDGTEFFFDDLRFAKAPAADGKKEGAGFLMTSDKRVWIRGKALELTSPAGFEGVLEGTGIDAFEFHPPVAALIDPRERSILKLDPAVSVDGSPGGDDEAAGKTFPPRTPAEEGEGGRPRGERVAVTCQGPLSLEMGSRKRDAAAPHGEGTFIRFQRDVKLFAVEEGVAVDSLPPPTGSRLECQHLEFELERRADGLVPRRALATGAGHPTPGHPTPGHPTDPAPAPGHPTDPAPAPGHPTDPASRVMIHFHKKGGASYTIDGDRLEWVLRDDGTAGASGGQASEAILSPRPTLRGEGIDLAAERAAFRLPENRLILETVQGTIRHDATSRKEPRKRKEERPALFPPAGAGAGLEKEGREDRPRSSLPSVWDVKADEAEFFFTGPDEAGGTESVGGAPRDLSRLIARSRAPGGVEIRSRPQAPGTAGTSPDAVPSADAGSTAEPPFVVTGDVLTYADSEKGATLEGSPGKSPRFEQGANWIESRRMHVELENGVAIFEDDVHGRLDDLKAARRGASAGETPAAGAPADAGPAATDIETLEIESSFLALRFEEMREIVDLLARGAADRPLRVTAHSTGDRWYRLVGPQLHWDQAAEVAQLDSLRAEPTARQPSGEGGASPPRLEYEGGDVRAGRIRFERKTWTANLTDGVLVRVSPSGENPSGALPAPPGAHEVEIAAGSAEIEFFPELERRGKQTGSLEGLSSIKSLRARRSSPDPAQGTAGALIQIKTPTFTSRTEELIWDSEARRLRFQGNGLQEIDVARDDFQGPITAREIVFDEEKKLLILQGGVQGRLVQARIGAPLEAEGRTPRSNVEPAALGASPRHLVWQFATSVLEIQLKEGPRGSGFELVSVRARDKVHLRNDEHGLQLLGDDLTYEEATRKVHVFSPDGRPQTLLCDRSTVRRDPSSRANEAGPEEVHKVVAQEIWALLQENPHAVARRGDPREWLIVSFHKDVIGSFHLPPPDGSREAGELGDTLKMVAERLTLHVDPSQPRDPEDPAASRRMIPWAVAAGNVDFSSGNLRATADRAVLEEPLGRLTLFGSPARLSRENQRVFEDPEIAIRRVAGDMRFEVIYKGPPRPQRPPVPDLPTGGR